MQRCLVGKKEGEDMWLWIWLVVAVAAAIGEAVTYDLFLASVAGAALVVAATSGIAPWPIQIGGFAVLSLIGISFIRPAAKVALGLSKGTSDAIGLRQSHLIGRRAIVTQQVTEDGGQIRVGQGEFWSARAYEPSDVFEPGEPVRIMVAQGLTVLVESLQPASEVDVDSSIRLLSQKGN